VTARPTLLFIAPWYLFPADSGGKLRSADLLKHLNRDAFSVTLASPLPADGAPDKADLDTICDRFVGWPAMARGRFFEIGRMRHLVSRLPIPVATDVWPPARNVLRAALAEQPDVVVVDFVHTHVLMPPALPMPSVMFTHNVETEIFDRHAAQAASAVHRAIWRGQARKMRAFEGEVLAAYDQIVTVAERDTAIFRERYGIDAGRIHDIATGIDMARYDCRIAPRTVDERGGRLVFTASMNSAANIDAIEWFMDEVWPAATARRPDLHMSVVGRNPPADLVRKAQALNWRFTGAVPSVEPFVHEADLYVVPLRVGGGTRLKIIEAVAMGAPIVSTDIGIEGIPLVPGEHYLRANSAAEFADRIDAFLADPLKREACARAAHSFVSGNFGIEAIARKFASICAAAIESHARPRAA